SEPSERCCHRGDLFLRLRAEEQVCGGERLLRVQPLTRARGRGRQIGKRAESRVQVPGALGRLGADAKARRIGRELLKNRVETLERLRLTQAGVCVRALRRGEL